MGNAQYREDDRAQEEIDAAEFAAGRGVTVTGVKDDRLWAVKAEDGSAVWWDQNNLCWQPA